jgi:hypothetical protein
METIKEISNLVSASIIAALAVNYFSPAGIALVGQWDTSQGVITANEKNDIVLNDIEIGDPALAKKMYDSQKFVLSMPGPGMIMMKHTLRGRFPFRWGSLMKKFRRFWSSIHLKKQL